MVQPTRYMLENIVVLCSHGTILHPIWLSILSSTTYLKFPFQNMAQSRKVPKPSVAKRKTTKSSFEDDNGNLLIRHYVNTHYETELLSATVPSVCLLPSTLISKKLWLVPGGENTTAIILECFFRGAMTLEGASEALQNNC
jgi:hypothetical protein